MKNLTRKFWMLALILMAGNFHAQITFNSTMPAQIEYGTVFTPPYLTATSPCGPVTLTWSEFLTINGCNGIYEVQVLATTACGDEETFTHSAEIVDTQAPEFVSIPADIFMNCSNSIPEVVIPSVVDNCDGDVEVYYTEDILSDNPCSKQIIRTFYATDYSGNSSYIIQSITILDVNAPVFENIPSDITIECDMPVPPLVLPIVSDNCDDDPILTYDEQILTVECFQMILRTFVAIDQCGNSTTYTQQINIFDTTAPVIEAEPVIYYTDQLPEVTEQITYTDNCTEDPFFTYSFVGLEQDPNYGAKYFVQYTVMDACSNLSTYLQTWLGCAPVELFIENELGGSLDGVVYTIYNNNDDVIETGVAAGNGSYLKELCLPAGCFRFQLTGPEGFNPNITFSLSGTYSGTISGNHTSNYEFSIGAPCGLVGCMNPDYCNYDPLATEPGICSVFCLDYVLEVFLPLPEENWSFTLVDPLNALSQRVTLPSFGNIVMEPLTTYTLYMNSTGTNGWNDSQLTFSYSEWNWSFTTTMSANGPNQVTFTTGGPGCMDLDACNYNPAATVDDGSCLTTYGCTDALALNYNPLANCSDNSCIYVINDEKSGATPLVVNSFGNCQSTDCSSLSLATVSANALSNVITGEDIWYSFVAPEPGISIKVTTNSNSILIELQNATGQFIDAENVRSTVGNEVLNFGNLIVGNTYYIAVRNFNSAQGKGAFTICLQSLRDSKCGLNNATTLTPCSKFHAFAVNASYYNYAFTSINSGLTYTLTNSPKTIDIMDVPSLLPNDTYQIKVMAVYRIANGMGQIENVVVVPAEICTKFIAPNAALSMQQSENCLNAGSVSFNTTIKAVPVVCNAVDYEWEFTNQNGTQPTFTHFKGNASRTLKLSTVPLLQNNSIYTVRVRQIFPNGVAGQFGNAECLSLNNSCRSLIESEDSEALLLETVPSAFFFPNPNNGNNLMIEFNEIGDELVEMEVLDITGKIVYNSRLTASNGSISEVTFDQQLSSGTYIIKMKVGEELSITKLIVE